VSEGLDQQNADIHASGYRVYYKQVGLEIVVLLGGGDKSTQLQDIKIAIELARSL
jgi:putative addiction module killer protein